MAEGPAPDPALARRYATVRARTAALAAPLSAEDCGAQAMPDASPVKWHLAHTAWFFETFVLEAHEAGYAPFDPAFRSLFNSYYNGVGARHPRAARGLLTRPPLDRCWPTAPTSMRGCARCSRRRTIRAWRRWSNSVCSTNSSTRS
jgi:hypothetical protein